MEAWIKGLEAVAVGLEAMVRVCRVLALLCAVIVVYARDEALLPYGFAIGVAVFIGLEMLRISIKRSCAEAARRLRHRHRIWD